MLIFKNSVFALLALLYPLSDRLSRAAYLIIISRCKTVDIIGRDTDIWIALRDFPHVHIAQLKNKPSVLHKIGQMADGV